MISVIIPVYNAEKTISKCIDSVLCQSYQNFEILLINDGSPDNSEEVCLRYAESDERIRYIKKENGGVSTARNLGIDEAKGEYISFIDSDDWIELDTLKVLLESASATNADIVIPRSRMVFCDAQGNFEKNVYNEDNFDLVVTKETLRDEFENLRKSWALYSTCGRLYKKELLERYSLRFDKEIKVLEDLCFNLSFVKYAEAISHISDVVYNFLVLGIEAYSTKRKYSDFIISNEKVYFSLKEFLEYNNLEFTKSQYDFLIGYWIFAVDGACKAGESISKRFKALRKISKKVNTFGLYKNCTQSMVDTHYKVLFKTSSATLFYLVKTLKGLKKKLRG